MHVTHYTHQLCDIYLKPAHDTQGVHVTHQSHVTVIRVGVTTNKHKRKSRYVEGGNVKYRKTTIEIYMHVCTAHICGDTPLTYVTYTCVTL